MFRGIESFTGMKSNKKKFKKKQKYSNIALIMAEQTALLKTMYGKPNKIKLAIRKSSNRYKWTYRNCGGKWNEESGSRKVANHFLQSTYS